jgi:hypothetical protein
MSKKRKHKENHEADVLPPREVMSLISPGATSVPGLGGLLGADPTAAAPPAGGTADLASGAAHHAADGQSSGSPTVSDQPQSLSTESSHTASSGS